MRPARSIVLTLAMAGLAAVAFAQAAAPAATRLLTKDTFYQMESDGVRRGGMVRSAQAGE